MSEGRAPNRRWFRFMSWVARCFADFWLGPTLSPARIEDIVRGGAKLNGREIDRLTMSRAGSVYTVTVTMIPDGEPWRIVIHGNSGKIIEIERGS